MAAISVRLHAGISAKRKSNWGRLGHGKRPVVRATAGQSGTGWFLARPRASIRARRLMRTPALEPEYCLLPCSVRFHSVQSQCRSSLPHFSGRCFFLHHQQPDVPPAFPGTSRLSLAIQGCPGPAGAWASLPTASLPCLPPRPPRLAQARLLASPSGPRVKVGFGSAERLCCHSEPALSGPTACTCTNQGRYLAPTGGLARGPWVCWLGI